MDYARFLIVGAIAFGALIMIYAVAVDELLANAIEHTDGDGPVVELPASESAGSRLPTPDPLDRRDRRSFASTAPDLGYDGGASAGR